MGRTGRWGGNVPVKLQMILKPLSISHLTSVPQNTKLSHASTHFWFSSTVWVGVWMCIILLLDALVLLWLLFYQTWPTPIPKYPKSFCSKNMLICNTTQLLWLASKDHNHLEGGDTLMGSRTTTSKCMLDDRENWL